MPRTPSVPATVDPAPGSIEQLRRDFPALAGDPTRALAAIRENLGGEKISERDLDAIRIPTGGGQAWTIPTLDGDEMAKEVEGVIVYTKIARAFWKTPFESSGGGTPPDCSSPNGQDGYGDPGTRLGVTGACERCPLAEFGSREDGRPGQACKQMRQVFLLMGGEQFGGLLPKVVTLPPTSLKPAREYVMRLSNAGVAYFELKTKITLTKVTGKGTPDYSTATFRAGDRLDDDAIAVVQSYRAALEPVLAARMPTPEEAGAAAGA